MCEISLHSLLQLAFLMILKQRNLLCLEKDDLPYDLQEEGSPFRFDMRSDI